MDLSYVISSFFFQVRSGRNKNTAALVKCPDQWLIFQLSGISPHERPFGFSGNLGRGFQFQFSIFFFFSQDKLHLFIFLFFCMCVLKWTFTWNGGIFFLWFFYLMETKHCYLAVSTNYRWQKNGRCIFTLFYYYFLFFFCWLNFTSQKSSSISVSLKRCLG